MSLAALFVQLLNGLAGASTLFLIAAGLSLIFGVTRIVNFAHGSLFMLGSYIAYSLITRIGGTGVGYWAAVLLAGIAVAIVGALIEILLLRRIYRAAELFQLIIEGLSNVRRHTQSRAAWTALTQVDGHVHLRIENEYVNDKVWVSFSPRSLTERAASLGGQLRVYRNNGDRTVVDIQIPL